MASAAKDGFFAFQSEFPFTPKRDISAIGTLVDQDVLAVATFNAAVTPRRARILDDDIRSIVAAKGHGRPVRAKDHLLLAVFQAQADFLGCADGLDLRRRRTCQFGMAVVPRDLEDQRRLAACFYVQRANGLGQPL